MGEVNRQNSLYRVSVVVAAVLLAVIAYLLISGGDDGGSECPQEDILGSAAKVKRLAANEHHPVYWVGPGGAETFELTSTDDGRIYVRYLTGGAEAGDPRPLFTTVGTYPVRDGTAALQRAARSSGAKTFDVDGGLGLVDEDTPTSVYLAYPGSEYEIEVFNPDPAKALRLVNSRCVEPVR